MSKPKPTIALITAQFLAEKGPAEMIQAKLNRLFADVADPNTEPQVTRKVTVEILVKPNERRESADVSVAVKSKLAGLRPTTSTWYFGRRDGRQVAVEHDPRQMDLDIEPAGPVEVKA